MNLYDIFENDDDMFAAPPGPLKYWNNTPAEFKELFNALIPGSGAAQTLEGELLRAANKLYYDYANNGFGNNVSGAENFLRTFGGNNPRLHNALDVLHPYTRGNPGNELDRNPKAEQAVEAALDVMMDVIFYRVLSASQANDFHPNPGDMYDYSNSDDPYPEDDDEDDEYEWDRHEDEDDYDDIDEAQADLDEPPSPERKQQTKTKTKFNYDPFQQQPDQPLAQRPEEPKTKSQGPKGFRKATAAGTRSATSNVNIPAQGADYLRNLNIDIDPDLAPYPDEEPRQEISTEVNTENLPAVAGEAIQAAGMSSPEFHQVARLPGNMSAMIRQLGKKLFGSMTSTPTEQIYMIGNLGGQGPNTRQEVNAVANFVRENGEDMGPGDIDFDAIMPGYQARTHQYVAAGIRWLLVKDFAGEYIYAWPEADSTTPKDQARLRENDEMFAMPWRTKVVNLLIKLLDSPARQRAAEITPDDIDGIKMLIDALQKNDIDKAKALWDHFVYSDLDEALYNYIVRIRPDIDLHDLLGLDVDLDESDDDIFAKSERPKHLAAASKWRRGGEASGTSLLGYVVTDYDTILKTFGEPIYVGGDKVPVEWVITFKDGKVATIYVYRIAEIPKGQYRWHVGGRNYEVVDRVAALLGTTPSGDLVQESLTPDGEFLDKASRVKHGDKIYWKMKFVGLATGEVRDGRIFFNPNPDVLGKHMTGIASLPIDQIVIR